MTLLRLACLPQVRETILKLGDEPLGVTVRYRELGLTAHVPNKAAKPRVLQGRNNVWVATVRLFCGLPLLVASKLRNRLAHRAATVDKPILSGVSGVLRAGRLTLLLGPPGAGKTTFMRALDGQLRSVPGKQTVSGSVKFNECRVDDIKVANFATMVQQIDEHIPVLTTQETLEFARQCRAADLSNAWAEMGASPELLAEMATLVEERLLVVLAMLGLARCADTVIGNDVLKGVSGGEKRRVTLGEMLVCGTKVMLLDEISTGLDAAATFDIAQAIPARVERATSCRHTRRLIDSSHLAHRRCWRCAASSTSPRASRCCSRRPRRSSSSTTSCCSMAGA
jgi:ABC-type multidrug transport system ATPase subunit